MDILIEAVDVNHRSADVTRNSRQSLEFWKHQLCKASTLTIFKALISESSHDWKALKRSLVKDFETVANFNLLIKILTSSLNS
jgi:hypothetical protein